MVQLILNKTWITFATTGLSVTGYRDGDDGDSRGVAGRIATYSGGRQRAITTEGVFGEWTFTLRQVTVGDTEIMFARLGQTVLVRDNRGRKMYGVLLEAPRKPWKEALDTYDVDIVLRLVTFPEDV